MTELYVERAGDVNHPAIVFLHGAGLSSQQWQPQLQGLSNEFYCLAPDLPEHGRTPGPFDLTDAARQVATLIREQIPLGNVRLVGLSLGGALALEVVRSAPECVTAALVTGTSGKLSRMLGQIMLWSAGMTRYISSQWLVNTSIKQFRIEPYRALVYDDLIRGLDVGFNQRLARSLMSHEVPTSGTTPVTVMVGGRETAAAKNAARKLMHTIPNAQGYSVPNVGHVWNLEAASLFNQTVKNWASHQPLPSSLKLLS